jgi:hypothetical protein
VHRGNCFLLTTVFRGIAQLRHCLREAIAKERIFLLELFISMDDFEQSLIILVRAELRNPPFEVLDMFLGALSDRSLCFSVVRSLSLQLSYIR